MVQATQMTSPPTNSDPNRVRVPNLVVKEDGKQCTAHDNQRRSEVHDVTIHPAFGNHEPQH